MPSDVRFAPGVLAMQHLTSLSHEGPCTVYFPASQPKSELAGPVEPLPVQYIFGGAAAFEFDVDLLYEALNSPLQAEQLNALPFGTP